MKLIKRLNKKIDVSNIQGNATTSANGLMSSTDKINLNDLINTVGKIGLGGTLPTYRDKNINNMDYSGFVYLNGCTVGGTAINNGYLLNLYYTNLYKAQFYISAYAGEKLQYRKCVNGTWSTFTNV